jgi:cellobiose-specific phosphotransferase system component IIB
MSTSMLVNKMKAEAQQRALGLEIYAVPVAEFERELPNADVILLGPQVKYEAARLTELAAPHGKAVAVIDMADYGMMRGAAVLDKALALLNPNPFPSTRSFRNAAAALRGDLYAKNEATMQTLKIAVIGGGSSYTPELIEGIILRHQQIPVTELALVDVEAGREKVAIIAALTQRMLKRHGLEQVKVSVHFSLDEAIRGAQFVLTQLRVGQLAARAADERLGLKYHLLGQETTGVGGFAKALRTIPVILQVARKVEALAPDAFILNFTNPAGIVTEAVSRYSSAKIIGLCNVPINMQHMIAGMLDAKEEEVRLSFAGLNHMVWVHKVMQGREEVTSKVIDMLCDGQSLSMNNIQSLPWPAEFLRALKAIPVPIIAISG